jgi:two-component system phosphate regulon sensor histidine kinase PhoR
MEHHGTRPEIVEAFEGQTGRSMRYSFTVKEEMLYVALPVEHEGSVLGVLRMSLFLKYIDVLLAELRQSILKVSLAIVFVSLVGAVALSRGLSSPIRELTRGAERVARGDFNVRVFLKNRDELRELADSFNAMTEQISSLFNDLWMRRDELDSIISSMQEGLVVFDEEDNIRLCNKSFENMVADRPVQNRLYWEILRGEKLSDLIRELRDTQHSFLEELELNGRFYLCSGTYIASKQEVVLVLHDMTEMKNLEKVKRDFVTNVSHELRTPLTAIKGFVETLEEEVTEDQKRYVRIIARHADRLMSIVEDLLLLSELEERRSDPDFDEVQIKELVEETMRLFDQKAGDKGLKLTLVIDPQLSTVRGDSVKLQELLINLIDNAISYTDEGSVDVILDKVEGHLRIVVRDTGIGIPRKHQDRIFERFYVVDKSRSKKGGGTGLGLSIVKHIVILHRGTMNLESSLGRGSTFTVTLPIASV